MGAGRARQRPPLRLAYGGRLDSLGAVSPHLLCAELTDVVTSRTEEVTVYHKLVRFAVSAETSSRVWDRHVICPVATTADS
jgi:hypothetical protein